jgi:hypothetical protein
LKLGDEKGFLSQDLSTASLSLHRWRESTLCRSLFRALFGQSFLDPQRCRQWGQCTSPPACFRQRRAVPLAVGRRCHMVVGLLGEGCNDSRGPASDLVGSPHSMFPSLGQIKRARDFHTPLLLARVGPTLASVLFVPAAKRKDRDAASPRTEPVSKMQGASHSPSALSPASPMADAGILPASHWEAVCSPRQRPLFDTHPQVLFLTGPHPHSDPTARRPGV